MKSAFLILAIVAVTALVVFVPGASMVDGGQKADQDAAKNAVLKAASIAKAIRGTTFSVSNAVIAAEKATGGKAISSQVEFENGGAVVEVMILKDGDQPALLEAEIDGKTNKVLEVEDADDEDEDEEDDDDDGDDADGDDDDDKKAGAK